MEIKSLRVIEVIWKGPFEINQNDNNILEEKGIYQIYGTHPVNGSNNLLYIGKTEGWFGGRMHKHLGWINEEQNEVSIYYGTISNDISEDIRLVEQMLIYYCAPPYNSSAIFDLNEPKSKNGEHTLVLNLFKRNLLPYEVSTLWYQLPVWEGKEKNIPKTHNFELTKTSG